MKNKGEILATILKEQGNCYFFPHNINKKRELLSQIMRGISVFENQLPIPPDRVQSQ